LQLRDREIRPGLRFPNYVDVFSAHERGDGVAGKEQDAMRISLTLVVGAAVATTLAGVSAVGCSSHSKPSTARSGSATSVPAQLNDYTALLIKASDINAPETFTASPPIKNPNGQLGVATTFSDQDRTHAIIDTIQVLPDPSAAANALKAAEAARSESLHGKHVPINVGTGGTTISGSSPDRSKGVTVLLFTEGKALATLEFDGPSYALAPPEFVTDVGQKQDTAIKKGLAG
jgi:hypothetical protein